MYFIAFGNTVELTCAKCLVLGHNHEPGSFACMQSIIAFEPSSFIPLDLNISLEDCVVNVLGFSQPVSKMISKWLQHASIWHLLYPEYLVLVYRLTYIDLYIKVFFDLFYYLYVIKCCYFNLKSLHEKCVVIQCPCLML